MLCEDFNDILNEVRKCTNKLLRNIIIAGDFTFRILNGTR